MLPQAFDYTAQKDCATLVLKLTGLTQEPDDLRGLLEVSAAPTGQVDVLGDPVVVHRPYFVAAAILDGQLNQKRVRELKGIKFDAPGETVAGLLRRQRSLDKALGLAVPEGMSAVVSSGEVVIVTNYRRGW